jgi:hypothetical protein
MLSVDTPVVLNNLACLLWTTFKKPVFLFWEILLMCPFWCNFSASVPFVTVGTDQSLELQDDIWIVADLDGKVPTPLVSN